MSTLPFPLTSSFGTHFQSVNSLYLKHLTFGLTVVHLLCFLVELMAHPMELFLVLRLSVTLPVTLIKEAVKGKGVADESQASKLSGSTLTRSLTLISIQLRQQGQIKGTGPIGVGVQGLGVLQIPLYCLAWHLILCMHKARKLKKIFLGQYATMP
ncbi:uncharacterized protein LOC141701924 isoform X2 [Apium graveolens]|uniref:uncharacterized protein LOC141701924 isoform X2 n=1 Tax=Apium graveolens TaxID=4045 RepID=UPI003D7A5434